MTDEFVVVGKITKAHGVRGEVSVLVLSETPERFEPGSALHLEDGRPLTIDEVRRDRGRLLVTFAEIPHREAAMELAGSYLVVPGSELPDLPEGSWWPWQIEGCEIVTEAGRSLGIVAEVVNTPANDVWVTRTDDDAELLIPALKDLVVSVDLVTKRIVVRDAPGLTE